MSTPMTRQVNHSSVPLYSVLLPALIRLPCRQKYSNVRATFAEYLVLEVIQDMAKMATT
jgi:hypothetical protein